MANVLYVLNLDGNLLSTGRIEEKGYKIEFAHGEARILSEENEVVLKARGKGRLYIVEEDQPVAFTTKTTVNEIWRRHCQSAFKKFESIDNESEFQQNQAIHVMYAYKEI